MYNEKNNRSLFFRVLDQVLGKFALMLGDEAEGYQPLPTDMSPVLCSVLFLGKKTGSVEIMSTDALCRSLRENSTGMDEAAGKDFDAFSEFTNQCCGHFLTEVYGTRDKFDLAPPSSRQAADTEWKEFFAAADAVAIVEGSPVAVSFKIKG